LHEKTERILEYLIRIFKLGYFFFEPEEIIKIDSLPAGGKRKNGLGLGSIKIGHFYYDEVGDVRLYILKPDTPYLLIKSKTEKIIVGFGKNENEALYAKLKNKL